MGTFDNWNKNNDGGKSPYGQGDGWGKRYGSTYGGNNISNGWSQGSSSHMPTPSGNTYGRGNVVSGWSQSGGGYMPSAYGSPRHDEGIYGDYGPSHKHHYGLRHGYGNGMPYGGDSYGSYSSSREEGGVYFPKLYRLFNDIVETQAKSGVDIAYETNITQNVRRKMRLDSIKFVMANLFAFVLSVAGLLMSGLFIHPILKVIFTFPFILMVAVIYFVSQVVREGANYILFDSLGKSKTKEIYVSYSDPWITFEKIFLWLFIVALGALTLLTLNQDWIMLFLGFKIVEFYETNNHFDLIQYLITVLLSVSLLVLGISSVKKTESRVEEHREQFRVNMENNSGLYLPDEIAEERI